MKLKGPERQALSGDNPKSVCIMMHGVGADGANLINIADMLAPEFPDTYFIAPNGPERFSGGGSGYQWFPYYGMTREKVLEGVAHSARLISEFSYELLDTFGLQPEKLVLLGFSQGAMLAIHCGITMQDNCAGVVALSGGLLKVEITPFEVRSQPPVCLIHGEDDEVVPYQMSETTSKLLSDLHIPVELHKMQDLGHSIDMACLDITKGFLKKILRS